MDDKIYIKKIINFTPEEEEIVKKQAKEFRYHLRGFGPTVRFIVREWAEMKQERENKESRDNVS